MMRAWTVDPPAKWKAGTSGKGETEFYFDCADCGAKEPEIAGIYSTDGTFKGIGLLPAGDGSPFVKTAMWCSTCWPARLAKATPEPKEGS